MSWSGATQPVIEPACRRGTRPWDGRDGHALVERSGLTNAFQNTAPTSASVRRIKFICGKRMSRPFRPVVAARWQEHPAVRASAVSSDARGAR